MFLSCIEIKYMSKCRSKCIGNWNDIVMYIVLDKTKLGKYTSLLILQVLYCNIKWCFKWESEDITWKQRGLLMIMKAFKPSIFLYYETCTIWWINSSLKNTIIYFGIYYIILRTYKNTEFLLYLSTTLYWYKVNSETNHIKLIFINTSLLNTFCNHLTQYLS